MSNLNANYYNAIDQIYHVEWMAKKLSRFEILRDCIQQLFPNGHPTQFIQVVGTSGKGSVARFIEAGVSLNYRAGCFNSPHLLDYRERFSINGKMPSQDDIIEIWEEQIRPLCIRSALKGEIFIPSYHEVNILIALCLFQKYQVAWAAIEAGMGGRYDQTTALDIKASVFVSIGRDHEKFLGATQWQRVLDKGGACQSGKPFFHALPDQESSEIINQICEHLNSPSCPLSLGHIQKLEDLILKVLPNGVSPSKILSAKHQIVNASLSLLVIQTLFPDIDPLAVVKKFADLEFTGRLQEIEPNIFIDIAHNPDKIAAFASEIQERFSDRTKYFILGLSGQRSVQECFSPILAIADRIIVTSSPSWKLLPPEQIYEELQEINYLKIPIEIIADPREAIEIVREAIKDKPILAFLTGSTYMIDSAINPDPYLAYINATYGWRNQP